MSINIIKTKETITRYEEQSILSAIERLSKQDTQGRLIFNLFDTPISVNIDNIKRPLTLILGFRIKSIHYETIKTGFQKYNINIMFPKRQTRKQKISISIINEDIKHYNGRN
jgi:hypothetical protein